VPRILKSQIKKHGRSSLTAYPEQRPIQSVPGPQLMAAELFKRPPKNDMYRTRYGRSLTLDRIQSALLSAQDGLMRDLTDMSRETIGLDPHLCSVLYKRFNSVASLPWEVRPAEGPGVDAKKAQAYADFVREQLMMVSNLRQAIVQLAWGLFDGRAALETHWVDRPETYTPKSVDGMTLNVRWRVGSLGWIHPRRLCFDEDRKLYINDTGMGSGFDKVGVPLDGLPFKFVQFTPQLFGDYPELEGLAPKCLYWSFFKRFGARERMVLLELFGKPWRIVEVDEDSDAGNDDLNDAADIVDQLGNTATARMPRGTKLHIETPDPKSGDLHEKVIEQSDKQISKLVLGQTGTTDAQPGALGGGMQALVMSNEQFVILSGDASMLGEVIENYLTDAIIELNFGRSELINAPRFVMRAETNPDKKVEAERMKLALDMGLPIEIDEAYEVLGFKKPEPGSTVIQMRDVAGPMGNVRSPVITISPEELAAVGKAIDEAAAAVTLPGDGEEEEVVDQLPAVAPENNNDPAPDPAAGVLKDVLGLEQVSREFERILLTRLTLGEHEDHEHRVDLEKNRQPDSVHGTIETLIDKGVREAARVTARWAESLVSAVRSETTGAGINKQLARAADRLDLLAFSRTIERRMTHSLMTGTLDSQWEDASGDQIAPEKFSEPETIQSERARLAAIKDVSPDFTSMAYKEALAFFKKKTPIPKSAFEKLSAAAKARSFTVAGLASEHMISVAKSELANAIVEGVKLSDFAARLGKRFESAGLTPLNSSHVETIFRTNLVTSYNVGRKAEMTQPDALKARPYWQIRTVKDDRQRDTHRAVDGWVLRATDPFWRNVGGPPFGFNCRCRTTTIRAEKLGDRTVRSGAEIRGLPDPGFDPVPL
jgi:SPP1 gp7 family putative phage head morphogenesis protein